MDKKIIKYTHWIMIDESLALKYTARNPFGCNIRTNCKKIFAKKYKESVAYVAEV